MIIGGGFKGTLFNLVCVICETGFIFKAERKNRIRKTCSPKCTTALGFLTTPIRPVTRTLGINVAQKNGQWKGDSVSYGAIHDYIKWHKPYIEQCERCGNPPAKTGRLKKLDLANISGEYRRDLDDWEWLCRKCHMISDGRMEKLQETRLKNLKKRLTSH